MIDLKKLALAATFAGATTSAVVFGPTVSSGFQLGPSFATAALADNERGECEYKNPQAREACLASHRRKAAMMHDSDGVCNYETRGDVVLEQRRQACLASHRHYKGVRDTEDKVCGYENKQDVAIEAKREACLRAHKLPITPATNPG